MAIYTTVVHRTMEQPTPIAQKLQAIEAYLTTLVASLQQGKLPVNLQPIALVFDAALTASPRLTLSLEKFSDTYNDIPTVLEAYAITGNLSGISRLKNQAIVFDRAPNGNYWIIPLADKPHQAWLVPNPNRRINITRLKSLSQAFEWPDCPTSPQTTFTLVKPALVETLPTQPLTWKLIGRGQIVTFLNDHICQQQQALQTGISLDTQHLETLIQQALDRRLASLPNTSLNPAPPSVPLTSAELIPETSTAAIDDLWRRSLASLQEEEEGVEATTSATASEYRDRASLKTGQNDHPAALANYNQAIALAPQYALAYYDRAVLKYYKLNDRAGGVADMKQAAHWAKFHENQEIFRDATNHLNIMLPKS
jgi:tetratricopeptide (TPR) repeat protein